MTPIERFLNKIKQENMQLLIEALRSGRYTKHTKFLKDLKKDNCMCLMGVACDLSKIGRWLKAKSALESVDYTMFYITGKDFVATSLAEEVVAFFALSEKDPVMQKIEKMPLASTGNYEKISWSQLNDSQFIVGDKIRELSFNEIADILESYYIKDD